VVIAKLAFDSIIPLFKPKPQAVPMPKSVTPARQVATPAAAAKPMQDKAKKATAEQSLSDTFAAAKKIARPPAGAQQAEAYIINGIFLSEGDAGNTMAIINNKVVTIGDQVDGAIVNSITIEGVELIKGDEIIKLRCK